MTLTQTAVLKQFCADVISAFTHTQQLDQFVQVLKIYVHPCHS